MAVGIVVVIVIAMALLIHSCSASATKDSLKNYNASVFQLIKRSDTNAQRVLTDLTNGHLAGLTTELATRVHHAQADLHSARTLSTPSQMAAAQSSLVSVMRLREQGIATIAANAQQAANKGTSKAAVYKISLGTSQLYGSDVIYKAFVAPDIARVLNANSIPVGTAAGDQQINPGQVISDLGWLQSTWIANRIGAHLSTAQANANNNQPGLHGHALISAKVDGTLIYAGSNNTIPASHAQTWSLNLTNGGNFNEYQVGCSVRIVGLSDAGTNTIPETTPGENTNCVVHLQSAPTPGHYSVIASIAKVPGEANLTNNTITYSVTFS
ncbi:MAG: hypothetical protein KGL16_03960 [Acidobacteriota bacterium]|nr:hypothetical protein [Acidobacteriota bacterium]